MNMKQAKFMRLPWWIPPAGCLGYHLEKPYWIFRYFKYGGIMQTIYGLN